MSRFLRLSLLLFCSVMGFSGGLLGWVRHNPAYRCLSFNNATVELDTSLYLHPTYPYTEYPAPDGSRKVMVDSVIVSPLRQSYVRASQNFMGGGLVASLQKNGIRRPLATVPAGTMSYTFWSADSQYLVYWNGSEFILADREGNDLMRYSHKFVPDGGWAGNRYFTWFEHDRLAYFDITTRTLHYLSIPPSLAISGGWYVDRQNAWVGVLYERNLYGFDLAQGTYTSTPLYSDTDNPLIELTQVSPDGQLIAYTRLTEAEYHIQVFSLPSLTPLQHFILPAHPKHFYNRPPVWSGDSRFLYAYGNPNSSWWQLDVSTGEQRVLRPHVSLYNVDSQFIIMQQPLMGALIIEALNLADNSLYELARIPGGRSQVMNSLPWEGTGTMLYYGVPSSPPTWFFDPTQQRSTSLNAHVAGIKAIAEGMLIRTTAGQAFWLDAETFTFQLIPAPPHKTISNALIWEPIPNSNEGLVGWVDSTTYALSLIRYNPHTNSYSTVYPLADNHPSRLTISPDGAYLAVGYAFNPPQYSLQIISMDRSEIYELGEFPSIDTPIEWTQCQY